MRRAAPVTVGYQFNFDRSQQQMTVAGTGFSYAYGYQYDNARRQLAALTNPFGRTTRWQYDAKQRVKKFGDSIRILCSGKRKIRMLPPIYPKLSF